MSKWKDVPACFPGGRSLHPGALDFGSVSGVKYPAGRRAESELGLWDQCSAEVGVDVAVAGQRDDWNVRRRT